MSTKSFKYTFVIQLLKSVHYLKFVPQIFHFVKKKVEIPNYWKAKHSYKTVNPDSQKRSNFNTVKAHSNINSFEHSVKIPTA